MKLSQPDLRICPGAAAFRDMACERTGLSDFGDAAREAGLEAYVASMADEV